MRANRPRDDLRAIGITDVHHGFEWRIPFTRRPFLLCARVAGYRAALPGGPIQVRPRREHEGALEGVRRGFLRGWAWGWDPRARIEVAVFVDGTLRATVPACQQRPDLALAGIGQGRHGFAWPVPDELADGEPHEFACRIAGASTWLSGDPLTVAIKPSRRALDHDAEDFVRGCARRPPIVATPLRPVAGPIRSRRIPAREPDQETRDAARGRFWQPLGETRRLERPNASGANRPVRLLLPVWGEDYIRRFCRFALPTLLSPGNLPWCAERHRLQVIVLTRSREHTLFSSDPVFQALAALAPASFIDIDDILARYFEPSPDEYATALTYAFLRGMRSAGRAACDTDFIFWNADFLAADGVFRTLGELIAAGVRCTLAPTLRIDSAIEPELTRRIAGGTALRIPPREWVALAARFAHPTVQAQTVNRFETRMTGSVNQLYWHVDDGLTVARVFLMFMLHMRPERLGDAIYGHCDFAFLPEFAPSAHYHYETSSDRLLILEYQARNREADDITFRDAPVTPREIAGGVARWTTREHRSASAQLAVFNSADIVADLASVRRMTDRFMQEVSRRLPPPIWHNGHFYWRDSLQALGLRYVQPGPDHPRSHLAAALRPTGYDVDVLRESWPDPAGAPDDIFGLPLPLPSDFDSGAWFAHAHARYFEAWLAAAEDGVGSHSPIDLISGHFSGFGWGLARRVRNIWTRPLGPDGRAVLLVRLASPRRVRLSIRLMYRAPADAASLQVHVNGASQVLSARLGAREGTLGCDVGEELVAAAANGLQILFRAADPARGIRGGGAPAFAAMHLE